MRGAPHNGFAWLMFRIKPRISAGGFGLPGRRRDFRVQYQAKALRCQAITVSGRTMCRLRRQPGHHRDSKTHKSRSERRRRKHGPDLRVVHQAAFMKLLDAGQNWSVKREEFRNTLLQRIAKTLLIHTPNLSKKSAAGF